MQHTHTNICRCLNVCLYIHRHIHLYTYIQEGDELVGVDYRDVREVPMMDVALMVLGVEGSKVRLKFMHASGGTVGETHVCTYVCMY